MEVILAEGALMSGSNRPFAMATITLDAHTARTLLIMAHDLFPHEKLGMEHHWVVVKILDKLAGTDAVARQRLIDGVAQLDASLTIPWVELSDDARKSVLQTVQDGEFFAMVRMETIKGLYGNPLVYRMFGYGGPSAELGGYIDRGFDDIGWLPNT
jgi:hypothetical protein